jgi:hypothetical protein
VSKGRQTLPAAAHSSQTVTNSVSVTMGLGIGAQPLRKFTGPAQSLHKPKEVPTFNSVRPGANAGRARPK